MSGWTLQTMDTSFRVYRRDFPAGEVALPGSGYSGGSRSMYVVAIE